MIHHVRNEQGMQEEVSAPSVSMETIANQEMIQRNTMPSRDAVATPASPLPTREQSEEMHAGTI
jgi:hypothetical protein